METPRKLLETPESRRRYNVARKGERDSLKSGRIWAISSQASPWEEGPTTRHGAAREGRRYSLSSRETARGELKRSPAGTGFRAKAPGGKVPVIK